jgi:hypothetical protein
LISKENVERPTEENKPRTKPQEVKPTPYSRSAISCRPGRRTQGTNLVMAAAETKEKQEKERVEEEPLHRILSSKFENTTTSRTFAFPLPP